MYSVSDFKLVTSLFEEKIRPCSSRTIEESFVEGISSAFSLTCDNMSRWHLDQLQLRKLNIIQGFYTCQSGAGGQWCTPGRMQHVLLYFGFK